LLTVGTSYFVSSMCDVYVVLLSTQLACLQYDIICSDRYVTTCEHNL
jgi:hypothetical protein